MLSFLWTGLLCHGFLGGFGAGGSPHKAQGVRSILDPGKARIPCFKSLGSLIKPLLLPKSYPFYSSVTLGSILGFRTLSPQP